MVGYKTIVKFKREYKEEFEKIASDIAEKDNTFIYKIEDNNIIISNPNKETAERRKRWFYAVFTDKLIYTIIKSNFGGELK